MADHNWTNMLNQWSEDILASEYRRYLPPGAVSSGWLGFPAANDEEIRNLEDRLKAKIPPSYRKFLEVSNGWLMTTPFIHRLWSTHEIEWFATRHPEWIASLEVAADYVGEMPSVPDEDYFVYGEKQVPLIRREHLSSALEVGSGEEPVIDVYLLIPMVVTNDGEWEACYLSAKSDIRRYPSFWDLMVGQYEVFLQMRDWR